MRIHYIQNYELADLGTIRTWAIEKGFAITSTRMYENPAVPSVDEFDLLIILGGIMGAYDEDKYPWLSIEKQFIREAVKQDKYVMGICLGAQLIADALGGRAYPHSVKEIGWWPVQLTKEANDEPLFHGIPEDFFAFEYHGDTFDLPEGSVLMAIGKGCQNQAFLYGDKVIGLQFHPEFDEPALQEIVMKHGSEIAEDTYVQKPQEFLKQNSNFAPARKVLFTLLDNIENRFKYKA
jgi:GMP synthase-like glutamine amidotransferase